MIVFSVLIVIIWFVSKKNEKMANSESILCGECVDICHKKAVKYAFNKKR